jgi:hypothetical protein
VSWKSNTYYILLLCVYVTLVIQRAERMFLVIICGMSCSIMFSTLSDTRHEFRKKFIEYKIYVLIFSTIYFCNIFHSKKNSARDCHKYRAFLE